MKSYCLMLSSFSPLIVYVPKSTQNMCSLKVDSEVKIGPRNSFRGGFVAVYLCFLMRPTRPHLVGQCHTHLQHHSTPVAPVLA